MYPYTRRINTAAFSNQLLLAEKPRKPAPACKPQPGRRLLARTDRREAVVAASTRVWGVGGWLLRALCALCSWASYHNHNEAVSQLARQASCSCTSSNSRVQTESTSRLLGTAGIILVLLILVHSSNLILANSKQCSSSSSVVRSFYCARGARKPRTQRGHASLPHQRHHACNHGFGYVRMTSTLWPPWAKHGCRMQ